MPKATQSNGDKMPYQRGWIQSASGRKIDLLSPDPAEVTIADIAFALSRICRYTGHCARFLSVAEHSVRVSWRAESLLRESQAPKLKGLSPAAAETMRRAIDKEALDVARWGLLHDATEAYLGDVSRPLKHLPGMEGYRQLEKVWEGLIVQKFGLKGPQPPEVSQADLEMLGTEAFYLMRPIHPEWAETCAGGKLPDPVPLQGGRGDQIGWTSELSYKVFLERYELLFAEGV